MYVNLKGNTLNKRLGTEKYQNYKTIRSILKDRIENWHVNLYNRRGGETVAHIKDYKRYHLLKISQFSIDPINGGENWLIEEKTGIKFLVSIKREKLIGEGEELERIYIDNVIAYYGDIYIYLGSKIYQALNTPSGTHDLVQKFFRLLFDYSKNINKGEKKSKE